MLKTRVIPIVTYDGQTAVQTVKFGRPRSIGSMQQALSVYERRACDELVILDIAATKQERSPRLPEMRSFGDNIFCPLTIGGGITTCEEACELIRNGADKVVIGAAATIRLIRTCAEKLGSQAVTAALDCPGEAGDKRALTTVVALASFMETAGAGEILLTSIPRQGTRQGYDLDLITVISQVVKVPVVANGGCGEPRHMAEALYAGAHAAAAGTMFAFTHHTPRSCAEALHREGLKVRLD